MSTRPWSTRFALWAAVCVLLLKAAVPWLASVSAQAQGKAMVEVCTVYGVATVALAEAQGPTPAPEHAGAHHDDHCALSALMAFAAPDAQPLAVAAAPLAARARLLLPCHRVPDACATWIARLKHGPPPFA